MYIFDGKQQQLIVLDIVYIYIYMYITKMLTGRYVLHDSKCSCFFFLHFFLLSSYCPTWYPSIVLITSRKKYKFWCCNQRWRDKATKLICLIDGLPSCVHVCFIEILIELDNIFLMQLSTSYDNKQGYWFRHSLLGMSSKGFLWGPKSVTYN